MICLKIDTSSNQKILVKLNINEKEFIIDREIDENKAQVVLPMIDQILKEHTLQLLDINSIEANTGPGSFVGIRVGVSVANALSFALKIPVNTKKVGELAEPTYA